MAVVYNSGNFGRQPQIHTYQEGVGVLQEAAPAPAPVDMRIPPMPIPLGEAFPRPVAPAPPAAEVRREAPPPQPWHGGNVVADDLERAIARHYLTNEFARTENERLGYRAYHTDPLAQITARAMTLRDVRRPGGERRAVQLREAEAVIDQMVRRGLLEDDGYRGFRPTLQWYRQEYWGRLYGQIQAEDRNRIDEILRQPPAGRT